MNDWIVHTNINVSSIKNKIEKIIKKTKPVSLEDLDLISTRGAKSKQYVITKFKEDFKDVQKKVIKEIQKYVFKNEDLKLQSAWTVKGYENGYHLAHNHSEHKVATVIYLDVPKKTIHNPGYFYYFIQENGKIKYNTIEPKKGSLIIMPIHIFHGCYPQAKGLRQTLNMDFGV